MTFSKYKIFKTLRPIFRKQNNTETEFNRKNHARYLSSCVKMLTLFGIRREGKRKKGKRKKGTRKKGKRKKANIYSVGKNGNGKLGNVFLYNA